jgi:hypothetical protein
MQNHVVTLIILVIALAFYFAGYSGVGNIAFIVGGLFELWFGFACLVKKRRNLRSRPTSTEPSIIVVSHLIKIAPVAHIRWQVMGISKNQKISFSLPLCAVSTKNRFR